MSYNSILQSNNTDLQAILNMINTLPDAGSAEQATPSITVNASGLITAIAGTKSSTKQLAFQAAKTITPGTVNQIAVSSGYYTGGDITVKGDSNLVAGNIKSGVSIFGISGTAEVGGETVVDDVSKEIIEGTITEISDDTIGELGAYAFAGRYQLVSVNFPLCSRIADNAFMNCYQLASVNIPTCTAIPRYAFANCDKLVSVNFPICSKIYSMAFNNCTNLASISFPACTYIDYNAFATCESLTTVNFPICATIGNGVFDRCFSLSLVEFPACTKINAAAFSFCYCLKSINLPVCASISSSAFNKCYILSSLTLGASSVCTLLNSNAFNSTPYAGYSVSFSGAPYIYVPSSLITAYQSATNWVYFSSYFSAIEGD